MKHDQGPDSSSKPYRRYRQPWGSAGAGPRLPHGPELMRRMALPYSGYSPLFFRGGEHESQPKGSLIGGSQVFQPATKLPPPAKPGLTTSLPGKSSLQLIERL